MNRENRLPLAHVGVAVGAFGLAACMAVMQAMSRASVHLPLRTAHLYYLSVTAHGVLMALVFTTFFIMGFGYVVARASLGRPLPGLRVAWASFWLGFIGVLLTTVTILVGKSNVLYTFYPPLEAQPGFYIGLALVVVGSWGFSGVMLATYRAYRRERPGVPVPLALHGMLATVIVWLLCTGGVAVEVVGLLIPWSLGWEKTIDPILARTLFWYFGHPLVYFWLLPAYVAWYTILPREAGGRLFSDPLGRVVFVMFIVLSTPVGFHHMFLDPGISARWKALHTINTYAILFPSLVTAFTIIASLEVAGRMHGGRGLFGWLARLPWGEPIFTSFVLAMAGFTIGGFGGMINAGYQMNAMIHNTAWVQGHFHLTVGTAVALTFMGLTYWLLPRLSGRALRFPAFAQVQPYLWFAGMMMFAVSNHVSGLLGMPRRVYEAGYMDSPAAASWAPYTAISAAGGVVLFVSAMSYVLVVVGTLLWGRRLADPPGVVFARALEEPEQRGLWDRFGLWTALAILLILIAYAVPIVGHLTMHRYGSPGFKPL